MDDLVLLFDVGDYLNLVWIQARRVGPALLHLIVLIRSPDRVQLPSHGGRASTAICRTSAIAIRAGSNDAGEVAVYEGLHGWQASADDSDVELNAGPVRGGDIVPRRIGRDRDLIKRTKTEDRHEADTMEEVSICLQKPIRVMVDSQCTERKHTHQTVLLASGQL